MAKLNLTQPVDKYDLGIVHACMGEIETACVFFEKSIEAHEPPMLFFQIHCPRLADSLQKRPTLRPTSSKKHETKRAGFVTHYSSFSHS